jgi:hypothetical protein
MDELQLLADCLPEQPGPDEDVIAAARRRVSDGRRSRLVPLAGVRPARRELLLRVGVPTAGIAAAAALVAGVVTALPASSPARPPANVAGAGYAPYAGSLTAGSDGGSDGRTVLLMAATKVAEETQPVAGRYWVTTGTVGNFLRVGPSADPYTILDESQVQYWAARSPKDGSPDNAHQLGAAPVSAADRTAWQQDGSPTTWDYVGQYDSLADPAGYGDEMMRQLSTDGSPLFNLTVGYGAQQFEVGNKTLTLAQLQALPANPAELEKLLLAGGVAPGEAPSAYLLNGIVPTLLEEPVTPAVRAALYQMLATMPGIKNLGTVTDPAGQQGEAVSYTGTDKDCADRSLLTTNGLPQTGTSITACTTQELLIINPATGLPLAAEVRYVNPPAGQDWTAPDGLISYEIFGQSHWTNADPPATAQSVGPPLVGPAPVPLQSSSATYTATAGTPLEKAGTSG